MQLTAIIGENNSGKSTILKAIDVFFESSPKLTDNDFYMSTSENIEIIITFSDLTDEEYGEFGSAVIDGVLTIKRVFSRHDVGRPNYETLAKVYPLFTEIRRCPSASERKKKFNEICGSLGLDKARSASQVDEMMQKWERDNEDKLKLGFVRGFFGESNVAVGKLRKRTSIIFVPASADFNKEVDDPKSSPIVKLLSDIARHIFENNDSITEFISRAEETYRNLADLSNFPQLQGISEGLTSIMKRYYSDSALHAEWVMDDRILISPPNPVLKIENNNYSAPVDRVGHGLQRVALLSVGHLRKLALSSDL